MKRNLLIAVLLLIVANVAWRIYTGWGLVTVDVENAPLSKIAASVARQGGIDLESNLDPATKVTMHVHRVPVTDALETLAAVTDSRWRLVYLIAPDKSALRSGLEKYRESGRPEGWKQVSYPVPPVLGGEDDIPPDPRRDLWNVKPQSEGNLQAYVENAARSVDVTFSTPENWNPPVAKAPASGEVRKAVPNLASAAGGRAEGIFLLSKGGRWGGDGPRGGGGDEASGAADGSATPRQRPERSPEMQAQRGAAMQERMQAEIDKLPADQRAAAQARLDKMREFWAGMKDLTPEERRAKIVEFMSDPARQGQMDERMASRDQRKTPEQRADRYRSYVARKQQAKAAVQ